MTANKNRRTKCGDSLKEIEREFREGDLECVDDAPPPFVYSLFYVTLHKYIKINHHSSNVKRKQKKSIQNIVANF